MSETAKNQRSLTGKVVSDKMEKTIISEKSFSNKAEHFLPFACIAALLLLLEFILRFTVFRILP